MTCSEKYRKSLHVTLALIFVLLSIFRFKFIVMITVMNCIHVVLHIKVFYKKDAYRLDIPILQFI